MTETFESHSLEEMISLGANLARSLAPGDVLAIDGELGAGKTHLVKGIVQGLAASADATSPTFAIIQEYPDGRIPVFHIDLYRIGSEREALAAGVGECLDDPDWLTVIEWPGRVPGIVPDRAIRVLLEITGESSRRVSVERPEPPR